VILFKPMTKEQKITANMTKIYFRVPFTLYFIARKDGYFVLAVKHFSSERGYYFKIIE